MTCQVELGLVKSDRSKSFWTQNFWSLILFQVVILFELVSLFWVTHQFLLHLHLWSNLQLWGNLLKSPMPIAEWATNPNIARSLLVLSDFCSYILWCLTILPNTSLEARGHSITTCNAAPTPKSKMATSGPQKGRRGLEKCLPLGFGRFKQLSLNKFFDPSTPSMRKVDDGEEKKREKRKELRF